MVATFNQLSGINALIYYTADIFAWPAQNGERAVPVGDHRCDLPGATALAMSVIDRFGGKSCC
jgi:hypothetical protein